MHKYFLLGKYSDESIKKISADRTDKSVALIKELGGEVISMYALLGGSDIVLIVEFASNEIAMKASLGLTVLTGITFTTYPAIDVDDFDKLLWEGASFYKSQN